MTNIIITIGITVPYNMNIQVWKRGFLLSFIRYRKTQNEEKLHTFRTVSLTNGIMI